jgi:SRSO17 transposase
MGLGGTDASKLRFAGYVEGLASVIGQADRVGPLRDYCVGLMLPCERKRVLAVAIDSAMSGSTFACNAALASDGPSNRTVFLVSDQCMPALSGQQNCQTLLGSSCQSPSRPRTSSLSIRF